MLPLVFFHIFPNCFPFANLLQQTAIYKSLLAATVAHFCFSIQAEIVLEPN